MSDLEESFRGQILRLRGRIGLTQRELAERVGVHVSSIQGWEAGANYPGVSSLKALVVTCFTAGGFSVGHEAAEAAALWAAAVRDAPRFRTPFDHAWFEEVAGAQPASAQVGSLVGRAHSWGEAPDVEGFVGRESEQTLLRQWIVDDHVRTVAMLGMGGLGKSLLATQVARQVSASFEHVFWRSLRDAPTPAEWLADIVGFLRPDDTPSSGAETGLIRRLLELLREQRCLLVLDNFETVLQSGGRIGGYRTGYERYGVLLRQIAEVPHQSCVIVTSRELSSEIAALHGVHGPVRVIDLAGLGIDDGRALLRDKQLHGENVDWQALIERHTGNALSLKVVGETIRETFDGSIADYVEFANAGGDVIVDGIRDLLTAQIERVSEVERQLLRRMAVEREPIGASQLGADLAPHVSRTDALAALEGLRRRSLLEHADGAPRWGLHPVVLEYATEMLINDVVRELTTGDLGVLLRQPLLRATAKDYVRRSQERLILNPVVGRLLEHYRSSQTADQQLAALLDGQRGRSVEEQGYGPGNLVNLLAALRGDLRGVDMSGVAIRQAYLHEVEAQDASLAGSHLLETVLGESFNYTTCLALSADGAYLVAGTASGEVCRWQVADRRLLTTLAGHEGGVYSVTLSDDGQLLASAGYDGTIQLWDANVGRSVAVLHGHAGGVRAVALSADGRVLASGGTDGTIRIWDVTTGRQVGVFDAHSGGVRGVAISAAGGVVASGGVDGTVRLWDAARAQALSTLEGHTGSVNSVALSSDGRLIASGSLDTHIRVWDTESGQHLATLQGHNGSVDSIALSADGRLVASGSLDGTVRLWDAATGRALATLHGHTGGVRGVALSGDGELVGSGSIDGTVRLWEADGGRPLAVLRGHTSAIVSVALSGEGRVVATGSFDGTVRLREVDTGQVRATLRGHSGTVRWIALDANGDRLASAGFDGTIRVWDTSRKASLAILRGHTGAVRGVAWTADGRLIVSGGIDGTVRFWDGQTWQEVAALHDHEGGVWSVALSNDGRLLVTSSDDGTVRLWDVDERRLVATLRGHDGGVWGVALSGNGRIVASSGVDATVRLWDAASRQPLAVLRGHTGLVYSVALDGDGRRVASSSVDGTVRLWNVGTGEPLDVLRGHTGLVYGVALTSNGQLLASTGVDGTVRLWTPAAAVPERVLRDDRRFERVDITGLTGVTDAQWRALVALGAVDRPSNQGTTLFPSSD
jgi:WD40 repeat protein/transcriptional regulator with XRE-family HTH domain